MVTSLRLRYHDLRGLRRSFSLDWPVSRSQVHLTSLAVNGSPSCHLTPSRNKKVSWVPSSLQDQAVARSGMIDCMLFCFACWSNITRLLNMPIAARAGFASTSSCIDKLGGESSRCTRKMPPDFCACAPSFADSAAASAHAAARMRNSGSIRYSPPPSLIRRVLWVRRWRLIVEPEVLEPVAVVDAVDHHRHALHLGVPAGGLTGVEDDRPGTVLRQSPLDLPHQLLALLPVGLRRLLVNQLVNLRAAIARVVTLRVTDVVLIELLVRIVD